MTGRQDGLADGRDCPVTLDQLGELYRSPTAAVAGLVSDLPDDRRIRLALFCYARAHLRDLAVTIAAACDPARLAELAGVRGQVLATQSRGRALTFGADYGSRATRPPISLAGARC